MGKSNNNFYKKWINMANKDLEVAKLIFDSQPEIFSDIVCFHCQQATEKFLKGVLTYLNIEFKKTHNLIYLLDLLSNEIKIEDKLYEKAEILEDYAVEARYPMPEENIIKKEEAKEAYNIAQEFENFTFKCL
ncbi:MAG: HEPN domain-containing protein [Bacillota bacterium]